MPLELRYKQRDHQIYKMRMSKGYTYKRIAEEFGVSRNTVSGAIYRYKRRKAKQHDVNI